MTIQEKKERIKNMLGKKTSLSQYYDLLEKMGDMKYDYNDYMSTGPIKVEEELKRVDNADYELCTALLTMLLREDRFSEDSFERRLNAGQVDAVLERMLNLLN
jgi:hypothetical protein